MTPDLARKPCSECKSFETPAYNAQAKYLFPKDRTRQREWIESGKCQSCLHVCPEYQPGPCEEPPVVFTWSDIYPEGKPDEPLYDPTDLLPELPPYVPEVPDFQ